MADFDEKEYWLRRHERLRGDIRAVGNVSRSSTQVAATLQRKEQQLVRVLRELFPEADGSSALDLGCGVGRLAPMLLKMGFDYVGVDLSPVAIDQARQRCPGARFEVADIVNYHSSSRFDLVILWSVLLHLVRDQDWSAALAGVAQVVRRSGYVVLIDTLPEEAPTATAEHVTFRTVSWYREHLPCLGLRFMERWLARDRPMLGDEAFREFFVLERTDSARS